MKTTQHLCAIVIITIIMGLIYVGGPQTYQLNANDGKPQTVYNSQGGLAKANPLEFGDTIQFENSRSALSETSNENELVRPIANLDGKVHGEVEERVAGITKMLFIGWILCIAVVLINWLVTFYNFKKNQLLHDAR